ncbi:hypothetical protein DRE_03451 [Drechslerella stenobrocha 248]|uniref:Uncharacterized protein n=1 Tax=Drechslerella stenobrocha 248 TaxID=1043628 RepID=W7I3V3_9PEZI|nr:hypothetical protein DRE_03451 [Drechslerella stenobrocha 248]
MTLVGPCTCSLPGGGDCTCSVDECLCGCGPNELPIHNENYKTALAEVRSGRKSPTYAVRLVDEFKRKQRRLAEALAQAQAEAQDEAQAQAQLAGLYDENDLTAPAHGPSGYDDTLSVDTGNAVDIGIQADAIDVGSPTNKVSTGCEGPAALAGSSCCCNGSTKL